MIKGCTHVVVSPIKKKDVRGKNEMVMYIQCNSVVYLYDHCHHGYAAVHSFL